MCGGTCSRLHPHPQSHIMPTMVRHTAWLVPHHVCTERTDRAVCITPHLVRVSAVIGPLLRLLSAVDTQVSPCLAPCLIDPAMCGPIGPGYLMPQPQVGTGTASDHRTTTDVGSPQATDSATVTGGIPVAALGRAADDGPPSDVLSLVVVSRLRPGPQPLRKSHFLSHGHACWDAL